MGGLYSDSVRALGKTLADVPPAILGICQPILDISATVAPQTLERYGLASGDMVLAEARHMPLYAELKAQPDVRYIAGGATQNSVRVAQWLLQEPGITAFMGCVGDDEYARRLEEACGSDGVRAMFMVDRDAHTGRCAVPVVDRERSLVTDLGASNSYEVQHLREPAQWKVLQGAKIVYSAGYFIPSSPESIDLASREMAERGGVYCMNLSAPFIAQVPAFKAVLDRTLPLCDYLFGNGAEARAYAAAAGWDTADVEFIATRLSLVPMGAGKPPRTVVITQGPEPTIVAVRGAVSRHAVVDVPRSVIVDTNGAGDAYVGGFLAALARGKSVEACCMVGAYAASVVIQYYGCTYPAKPGAAADALLA